MGQFPVSLAKHQALESRMRSLGIFESDLSENFVRSGGNGGQNVNKTSTCVMLTHLPSGISIRCQRERSQGLNRFFARRELCDRIEALTNAGKQAQAEAVSKIRRQKAKRSRRTKQKILESKRHRSGIKDLRKKQKD